MRSENFLYLVDLVAGFLGVAVFLGVAARLGFGDAALLGVLVALLGVEARLAGVFLATGDLERALGVSEPVAACWERRDERGVLAVRRAMVLGGGKV